MRASAHIPYSDGPGQTRNLGPLCPTTATRPPSLGRSNCAGRSAGTPRARSRPPTRPGRWPIPTASPQRGRKLFVLDMFPYPSGTGLHVGHPLGFTGTDVYSRYQRMAGRNVLYTMGFDAFGLPAEQFAVQTGTHPAITTGAERRHLPRADPPARPEPRPAPLDRHHRPGLLPLDAVDLPADLRVVVRPRQRNPSGSMGCARPISELRAELDAGTRTLDDGRDWSRLSASERADVIDGYRLAYVVRRPGELVPGPGHGRRQRGGHGRRAQRPRQLPGVQAQRCASG